MAILIVFCIMLAACASPVGDDDPAVPNNDPGVPNGEPEPEPENIDDYEGLLPVGSVVRLSGVETRLMVVGLCQIQTDTDAPVFWDYCGVIFPQGFLGGDTYLFNHEQIEKIYSLGLQDEEQRAFKELAEQTLRELREQD